MIDRIFLIGSIAAAATFTGILPAGAAVASSCAPWVYSDEEGFEGEQHGAVVTCTEGGTERALSVLCTGAYLTVQVKSGTFPRRSDRPQMRFDFDGGAIATYPIYGDAHGEWTSYVPRFDEDHPLITALRNDDAVDVTLGPNPDRVRYGLVGSNRAIGRVLAACNG
ncbi:MAG: hypothetical protein AAF367_11370 [Pseudomonadota bacterium]